MVTRRETLLVGVVLLLACGGPREPGAVANEVVYWKVESSDVEFGACTDDPEFRKQIQPVAYSENSYFVYKVNADKTKAINQSCESFDPSTCKPSDPELSFDIVGDELQLTRELKAPLGDGGCQLQTTQSWIATDKGTAMSLDVSNAMSLVDAPADCQRIEADVKAQSPNGLAFQGCVVTYKLGFSHP